VIAVVGRGDRDAARRAVRPHAAPFDRDRAGATAPARWCAAARAGRDGRRDARRPGARRPRGRVLGPRRPSYTDRRGGRRPASRTGCAAGGEWRLGVGRIRRARLHGRAPSCATDPVRSRGPAGASRPRSFARDRTSTTVSARSGRFDGPARACRSLRRPARASTWRGRRTATASAGRRLRVRLSRRTTGRTA